MGVAFLADTVKAGQATARLMNMKSSTLFRSSYLFIRFRCQARYGCPAPTLRVGKCLVIGGNSEIYDVISS
jgi:hypothetical protein